MSRAFGRAERHALGRQGAGALRVLGCLGTLALQCPLVLWQQWWVMTRFSLEMVQAGPVEADQDGTDCHVGCGS